MSGTKTIGVSMTPKLFWEALHPKMDRDVDNSDLTWDDIITNLRRRAQDTSACIHLAEHVGKCMRETSLRQSQMALASALKAESILAGMVYLDRIHPLKIAECFAAIEDCRVVLSGLAGWLANDGVRDEPDNS